jgi:REP element-mobilizing transposase RayT
MDWLFEARKRFNLSVLNYMATSNHIHLFVYDIGGADVIPKSMQLIASRTGQEYNTRKDRKGAFWEDRYHATAVEKNSNLNRCLIYIDLNMVRAGVVDHPEKWSFCGYNEIQHPPKRYRILDMDNLVKLMGCKDLSDLQATHKRWVQTAVNSNDTSRQTHWTESIATGSKSFVEKVKNKLGFKARGRSVTGDKQQFQLRENGAEFGNSLLPRFDNTWLWKNS